MQVVLCLLVGFAVRLCKILFSVHTCMTGPLPCFIIHVGPLAVASWPLLPRQKATSAAKSKGLFQCGSGFGKKPDMEVVRINLIKHNPSCSFTGACATMRHQTILPDVSNLMTPQPADCSSMPKLEAGKWDVLRSRLFRHKPHINSITPKHRSHTSSYSEK